jgi:hypothetical protein
MKSNKRKTGFTEENTTRHDAVGSFGRATQDVLGGAILENERTRRIFPFLLFLAGLAFIYITNDYVLEKKVREITKMEHQIKELRYEYISVKSDLMTLSKQSQLEKRLESIGIKETQEPLKTLVIYQKQGK